MRYLDKSTGEFVDLEESRSEFLLVAKRGEEEAVPRVLSQRVFSVVRSSSDDNVYVLRVSSESESLTEIRRALKKLESDPAVEAIAPALRDPDGTTRYIHPGRVVVQLATGTSAARAKAIIEQLRSSVTRRFRSPGLYELAVEEGSDIAGFIAKLNARAEVAFAEPSYYSVDDIEISARVRAAGTEASDEEEVGAPWNLQRMAVPDAWKTTRGGGEVVVAVIDGWPDAEHEALQGRFLAPLGDPLLFTRDRSISSHATNIASLIAGESARMVGVAPGVRLLPIIVDLRAQLYAERADAIRFVTKVAKEGKLGAVKVGRVVLACSWRVSGDVTVVRAALMEAAEAGLLMVFSAGNEGTEGPHFPSDYSHRPGLLGDSIISVAATDGDDRKAVYSNYSANVDLAAPGGDGLPFDARDILCADAGNTYEYAAGTSIAVPHVAGVAALALSINPTLTAKQLKALLLESCDPLPEEPGMRGKLGAGRLNAARAVELARLRLPPVPEPEPVPEPAPATTPTPAPVEASDEAGGPSASVEVLEEEGDGARPTRQVRRRLAALARELRESTGWSMSSVEIARGGVKANVFLS